MRQLISRRLSGNAALALLALLLALAADARAVSIAWVPVGNPGNPPEFFNNIAYGDVSYSYYIGQFDVTVAQYVEFLNAKDSLGLNTLGLYNSMMSDPSDYGGINFNNLNLPGSKYSVIPGDGNHPVNNVSWYSAIRFANWLNNGQGILGDTETGAYTLLGGTPTPSNGPSITRNAGAKVFLPSEAEWFKAAYYDPRTTSQGGPLHHYWTYPTTSNTAPTATIPPGPINSANYNTAVHNLTDVGAYSGTTSYFGAFDMGGDVSQWNESLYNGNGRGWRGGSFLDGSTILQASFFGDTDPGAHALIGFRVDMIPEPSGLVLAVLGLASLTAWHWTRRKLLARRTRM